MEEFEYKVGDYVYCYKDINSSNIKSMNFYYTLYGNKIESSHDFIFKKGNLYKIKEIEIFNSMLIITIGTEVFDLFLGYHSNTFYNYFLSKIEYRKIKLENLNERF